MFELTLIQKVMLGGLAISYLWFFQWIARNNSGGWKGGFSLKRKKDSSSDLGYTPAEGYFDQIQETKKRFGSSWFNKK